MDNPEIFDWTEVNHDAWEKTYKTGDVYIYIEDSYKNKHPYNQTEISDWHNERYEIKLRDDLTPGGETLHSTMDWNEAEAYLEAKVGDFQ